jgi:hypothetical protein
MIYMINLIYMIFFCEFHQINHRNQTNHSLDDN